MLLHLTCYKPSVYYYLRKELSLNQKNKGAAIEKNLFVVQGSLEMLCMGLWLFGMTEWAKIFSGAKRVVEKFDDRPSQIGGPIPGKKW